MQARKPGGTSLVQPSRAPLAPGGVGKHTLVALADRAPTPPPAPPRAKPRTAALDDGFPLARRVAVPAARTRTSTALLHRAFGRRKPEAIEAEIPVVETTPADVNHRFDSESSPLPP